MLAYLVPGSTKESRIFAALLPDAKNFRSILQLSNTLSYRKHLRRLLIKFVSRAMDNSVAPRTSNLPGCSPWSNSATSTNASREPRDHDSVGRKIQCLPRVEHLCLACHAALPTWIENVAPEDAAHPQHRMSTPSTSCTLCSASSA